MSAKGYYACPCLNVRIVVDQGVGNHDKGEGNGGDAGLLEQNHVFPPGSESQITVSQPLLTSRSSLTPSPSSFQSKSSLTTLFCLNCKTVVYSVDKLFQNSQSMAKTTVGFNRSSTGVNPSPAGTRLAGNSNSESPSPARKMAAAANDEVDQEVLRPDPSTGTLWISKACIEGDDAISQMSSSIEYSQIFGLKTERAGEEELVMTEEEGRATANDRVELSRNLLSSSDRRRTKSPGRPFQARTDDSSSMSPSPARNKPKTWSAHRTEEEEGDDLDTLHLLENLLPPIPTSLFQNSPSNSTSQQTLNSTQSPRRAGPSSISSSSYFPIQNASGTHTQKKLESQLDASALTELRTQHESAKLEIHQLLQAKRKELTLLRERISSDAKRLMGRRSRSNSKEVMQRMTRLDAQGQQNSEDSTSGSKTEAEQSAVSESGSPLFERRRPLIPSSSEMGRSSSQISQSDNGTSNTPAAGPGFGGLAVPGRVGASSTSAGLTTSTGSYLSASFAMRGRDPPKATEIPKKEIDDLERLEDEEEWYAQKRRLRERYPHADHSALPSAVNSDDEGNVEVKKDQKTDAEDESRGRGRGRGAGRASKNEAKVTPKKDEKVLTSGGPSLSLEQGNEQKSPSDELSKSLNIKKGALKASTPSKVENQPKFTSTGEKKVAFAEAPPSKQTKSGVEQQKEVVDEGANALFEIDEDLDEDETPNSSDITLDNRSLALKAEKDALQDAQTEDEILRAQEADIPSTADSIAQSLPAVGSFSAAMANSERQKRESVGEEHGGHKHGRDGGLRNKEEELFDPASLRLDGDVIYSSEQRDLPPSTFARSMADDDSFDDINDTSVFGSRPRPSRRQSSDPPDALLSGFPQSSNERSSTIGFRVAVGEAEAQLSGLLAPHAPSHRNLWSLSRKVKTNGKDKQKYELKAGEDKDEDEEERDSGWSAWQKRAQEASEKKSNSSSDAFARSVPIGISGILSPENRGLNILSAKATTRTTTTYHDENSGFDMEPKTSLPYREKKFTPSLRKATRHLALPGASQGQRMSLSMISDVSETGGSTNDSIDGSKPTTMVTGIVSESQKPTVQPSNFQYSVPASVTRGFQSVSTPAENASLPTSTQSTPMLGSKGSEFEVPTRGRRAIVRDAYVQPPPPSTYQLRLEPNDANRPDSIQLEQVEVETGFSSREEEEEEEGGREPEDLGFSKDLDFMHTIEQLKTNKRTGWLHHRVSQPESIADHMYRMGLLSMLLPNTNLDIGKCVQLCLVHDIAEALVGDLTPLDGVSKDEKLKRERDALLYLVHDLLGSSPAALRLEALWMEYEDRETLESKAVKDLDRFELGLQAVEYERRFNITDLQPFFVGSLGNISHPTIRKWARQLVKEREKLWEQTPFKYQQIFPKDV